MSGVYAHWAPLYRKAGFEPRPVTPGTKACHLNGWQARMNEADFEASVARFGGHGISLLMGSQFPDGTTLAALDVDDDAYVEVAKVLMGQPLCVRQGKRGVIIPCRLRGPVGNLEFRLPASEGGKRTKHCELLALKKIAVIPPSIHPDLGTPYKWLGVSLLDIPFEKIPVIER
jgi:hypothetical protein